jgi:hypothetical protein
MKKYLVKSPVLIIFYNRYEKSKNIIQTLIDSEHIFSKLYFRVDGPKNSSDRKKIKKVLKLLKKYKGKNHNVIISYEKKNLGLQHNIIKSIDYVLNKNDRVIVLEDDHIPSNSFFEFCDSMLERYKNNSKIYQISGSCYLPSKLQADGIYFSKFADCVGWATWKTRWSKLLRIYNFYFIVKSNLVKNYYNSHNIAHWFYEYLFREYFVENKKGLWSTWWQLSIIKEYGLCVNPKKNLVIHDGLSLHSEAEHFDDRYSLKKKITNKNINVKKIKSIKISNNKFLDNHNFKIIKKTDPIFRFKNRIYWILNFLPRLYRLKNKKVSIKF